ncbi:hypothetical protein KP509_18G077800 [Ceratopteris richardii]|uniref:DNL-type domain-containing protein n=2 Tax=Ceratopteris richardii TaxID=49495 RepID=A0A8T2SVS7_CERRI|nr:hypothetical protein KP509_18G077800 [Ceratopteris richardii]
MAFRSLFRQARFKGRRPSGNYFGTYRGGIDSVLGNKAENQNFCSYKAVSTLHADRHFCRRGYSTGATSADTNIGLVSQDVQDSRSDSNQNELKSEINQGPKISERHNLAMIFTCTVCQTRSAKTMSRQTYEKGVVIVRCGGCKNLHLIADRLGWFGEPGSVEDFLQQKGIEVRKGSEESYEFTMEDLAGWSSQNEDKGA